MDMRQRTRDELNRMIQVVRDDAEAAGEHDHKVSESVDKVISLEQTAESTHQAVIAALERIEKGTFGQCQTCGGLIPLARLEAIPFTAFCVECESKLEADAK